MDDRPDPISQFFPDADPDSVDLYAVLSLASAATLEDIKKAYRKLALVYHPDKHATASDAAKADASLKFQQVGFAYAVLGDEKRRARYDRTGKTDEGFDIGPGEDGWEAYFEDLFDRVTKEKLDEMKKEYQGSAEEVEDIKKAYVEADGSIDTIMQHIPHSTHDDEARFIVLITDLIRRKELPSLETWEKSINDEKARLVRKKQSDKEAREAEALAKELGVWDEFYGSGKAGSRKGKGKAKGKAQKEDDELEEDEEDHSALQALILKKQKNMDGFFDSLAAKYAQAEDSPRKGKKGKKRGKAADEGSDDDQPPAKKSKKAVAAPPEIDDEEFSKLQKKLFGDKTKRSGEEGPSSSSTAKAKRTTKGRKARR